MTPSALPGLDAIDWSRPWLAPLRDRGEQLAQRAREHGLVAALNSDVRRASLALAAGPLRFVAQSQLPVGEAYEAFIARTATVPTRDNLHDLVNGLIWLAHPAMKRRLNEWQAQQLALGAAGGRRGEVRDALTLFDENAAWWQAPAVLVEALRRRDWSTLFITQRSAWADARLTLFGHALIDKLTQPRKAITAHVWVVPEGIDAQAFVLGALDPQRASQRASKRHHLALPVLGVPGWWPANEAPDFYRDPAVFRAA